MYALFQTKLLENHTPHIGIYPYTMCGSKKKKKTTTEGHWKFRGGGGGSYRPKLLKERMGLNGNFQRGGGVQTKKTLWGGGGGSMDIFWNNTI